MSTQPVVSGSPRRRRVADPLDRGEVVVVIAEDVAPPADPASRVRLEAPEQATTAHPPAPDTSQTPAVVPIRASTPTSTSTSTPTFTSPQPPAPPRIPAPARAPEAHVGPRRERRERLEHRNGSVERRVPRQAGSRSASREALRNHAEVRPPRRAAAQRTDVLRVGLTAERLRLTIMLVIGAVTGLVLLAAVITAAAPST